MTRRKRSSSSLDPTLVAIMVVVVLVLAIIQATHGLALLAVPLAGWGAWGWKQRQRRLAAEDQERRIAFAADLGRLLSVTPTEFERLVGDILGRIGFGDVRHVGRNNDRGADLLAVDPQGRRTVVQCKQYAPGSRIGSPVVRDLIGAVHLAHAQHAVLATTATFTVEAQRAAASAGFDLMDGRALVDAARRVAAKLPQQRQAAEARSHQLRPY